MLFLLKKSGILSWPIEYHVYLMWGALGPEIGASGPQLIRSNRGLGQNGAFVGDTTMGGYKSYKTALGQPLKLVVPKYLRIILLN